MDQILNVCVGHQPFPKAYAHYVDYTISPLLLHGVNRLIVVPDSLYGENGSSLSEYAQLFWLNRNLEKLLRGQTHIRLLQYRRFVSDGSVQVARPSSVGYAKVIREDQLQYHAGDFLRYGESELVNAPFKFAGGVLGQYATSHELEDILDFAKFLHKSSILSKLDVAQFLRYNLLIPASTIGVLSIQNFKRIFEILHRAAAFLNEKNFTVRKGYQRRNMGFLLERLNSHLLLEGIQKGLIKCKHGEHIVISESDRIIHTVDINSNSLLGSA
jgi:hypothetical protein